MEERKQNSQARSNEVLASKTLHPILCGFGINSGIIEMTMQQYLAHVKSKFYTTQVEAMRRETDPVRQGQLKKKLFYILPQGHFKEGRRSYALAQQPTKENIGYAPMQMLDLDQLPEGCATPGDAWYRMRCRLHDLGLAHYPLVVMESVSGKGLHIYVRLTEEMAQMNRHDVILFWSRLLGADFDLAVTDPARRAFQSPYLYSPDADIALLFGAELTDKQREAMGKVESEKMKDESFLPQLETMEREKMKDESSLPNGINFTLSSLNFQLETIAKRLIESLCGTTTPPEGSRNNTLYEAARQMAYLDGITEEEMLAAFAPLAYLGLPQQEARQCIRSAMRHEKTWLYTLPPELQKSLTPSLSQGEGDSEQEAAKENYPRTTGTAMLSVTPPREGSGEAPSLPPLISLFTPLVPENTREAAAAMVFAPLGSYLNNTVEIRDVSGKRRKLQFTSIIVGKSSSGKGFVDTLSNLITERQRQRDLSAWAQIEAWQEQKRTTPKGEPTPLKPQVPIHLLPSNMTEPALLERLKALEPTHGRAYIRVAEIDDLRKMQTVASSRLGAGQEIILSAFDTEPYGAMRVSADAVSAMTVMSLNIVASSTFPGTQDFFRSGVERGSVGRCDIAIVHESYDIPRYQDPDDNFQAQLDLYIDRLEQATGLIESPDIDRTIEEIRLSYSDPTSPLSASQNPEYFQLSHRQLLITKQKATILYICNGYQWDPTWEPWLHHAFYYGMECKITVFNTEIESWIKRQCTAATPRIVKYGPKSELDTMPQTFTLADLVAQKRSTAPSTATDKELTVKAQTLIRTWTLRGRIAATDNEGEWQKI